MTNLTTNVFEQAKPWVTAVLFLVVATVFVWQGLGWLNKPTTMPIKYVRVSGEMKHLSQEELSASLSALVDTGYFALDADDIVKAVKNLEWVNKAKLRRVWPDTIVLFIEEQKPMAVWNEVALLNQAGDVFRPTFDKALLSLPHLVGIEAESQQMLKELKKLNHSLAQTGFLVKTLNLAEHGSWSAELNNGTKIKVGDESPAQKIIKSLTLLASVDEGLIEHLDEVDLRYPNGMAVKWVDGYQFNDVKAAQALKKNQPTKG